MTSERGHQVIAPGSRDHWGESDCITRRVEAYRDRIKDGHFVVGSVPDGDAIQLCSNDYLSLSNHPAIVEAQVQALQGGHSGLYMSAVFLNEKSDQAALEQQMAAYMGTEAAVLCQSGWVANVGLIQALADTATPVYIDHFAHASLWEGARVADAPVHAFKHNRVDHLESMIDRHGAGLIVVDAIYSSDGTICPIAEIAEVSERTGCVLVVDESHSIGVYGPNGEGLVSLLGLEDRVHYRTFSLSKAFVTRAGMIAGPKRVMSYFPYESRPAIFSSAVMPQDIIGLAATLKVIQEEDWRRQQLWYNARHLRQGLSDLGYAVDASTSHVVSLHSGKEQQTIALRDVLEARGVFGAVFCAPATPKNHALIRLSVNAGLSEKDLDQVIDACREIRDSTGLSPQPSGLFKQDRGNSDQKGHQGPVPAVGSLLMGARHKLRSVLSSGMRGSK